MAIIRPRQRLVYFRVTEDEFRQLNVVCESTGARSMSDLARTALQNLTNGSTDPASDRLSEKLNRLEVMILELNNKLHELSMSLRRQDSITQDASRIHGEMPVVSPNIGGGK